MNRLTKGMLMFGVFVMSVCFGFMGMEHVEAAGKASGQNSSAKAVSEWGYPDSAPTVTWSGQGTQMSPYLISNAQQLADLSYMVNHGNTYEGICFKLTQDIILNDETFTFEKESGLIKVTDGTNTAYMGTGLAGTVSNTETPSVRGTWYADENLTAGTYAGEMQMWTPIGLVVKNKDTGETEADYQFKGGFNGDNHSVSGAFLSSDDSYQGLFGDVENGTIENLTLEDSLMYSTSTYLSGIVSSFVESTMKNCKNSSIVMSSIPTGQLAVVGGVIGISGGSIIENSANEGIIVGNDSVGGVIAYSSSTKGTGNTYVMNTIRQCSNSGYIYGTKYVGGICGFAEATNIENAVTNTGAIIGDSSVGGICGMIQDMHGTVTLDDCKNVGSITAFRTVGGIVGEAELKAGSVDEGVTVSAEIKSCNNEGTVTATATEAKFVAGIVGFIQDGNVVSCNNSGTIKAVMADNIESKCGGIVGEADSTVIDSCINNGKIQCNKTKAIGGIVGFTDTTDGKNDCGTVKNCINNGTVEALTYTGGIIGISKGVLIDNENNAAITGGNWTAGIAGVGWDDITGNTNSAAITGAQGSSGIVAYVEYDGSITGNTNSGDIEGTNMAGGIIGYAVGTGTVCDNNNLGTVKAVLETGTSYAGGIIGYDYAESVFTKIDNNVNTGNISASNNTTFTGGIVGCTASKISNCKNTGIIKGVTYAGGIGGYCTDKIEDCENQGIIGAENSFSNYAGGIAGRSTSGISSSNNTAAVTGNTYSGGIGGYILDEINSCNNKGQIKAVKNYAGGIVGANYKTVSKCINTGKVESDTTSTGRAGGIVGLSNGTSGTIIVSSAVTNCINTAEVRAVYVGGIVSRCYLGSSVMYCMNTGEIYAQCGGGIVAENYYYASKKLGGENDIYRCGNMGTIYAQTTTIADSFVGGIIGTSSNVDATPVLIQECYNGANIDTSNLGEATTKIGGIIANVDSKKVEEMTDTYYLDSIDQDAHAALMSGGTAKPASSFQSGEIAFLLNGEKSVSSEDEPLIWYQTLYGTKDASPVLDDTHAIVYQKTQTGAEPTYYNIIPLSNDMIAKIANKTETGQSITLTANELKVTAYGKALVLGQDYKVTGYSNNVKPGTAKVTIQGIGEYKGTATAPFQITAKPATQPVQNQPAAGTKLTSSAVKATFTINAAGTKGSNGVVTGAAVTYTGTTNKKATSVSIPTTITANGITYRVTAVSANAFKNNKKLKAATIGSNITSIGANAFSGCKKLKKITVKSKSLKSIGKNAFKGTVKKMVVKVPGSKKKAYKKLFKKKGNNTLVVK